MQRVVEKVVGYLEKKEVISPEDHQIYAYGVDDVLYTFISTAGLMLIGLFWGRMLETAIIIATFYTNQSFGGGFHATTHWRCFLTMAIGLICCLSILLAPLPSVIFLCLGIAALMLMMLFPLVRHPNKSFLEKKRAILKRRSQVVLVTQLAIFLYVAGLKYINLSQAFAVALVGSAVSRFVAVFLDRKRRESSS